jgi:hypothetical protein
MAHFHEPRGRPKAVHTRIHECDREWLDFDAKWPTITRVFRDQSARLTSSMKHAAGIPQSAARAGRARAPRA